MPHRDEAMPLPPTPAWALQQAREELDGEDVEMISRHAERIAGEARDRDDERHDEYDDPDQGGEA